MTVPTLPHQPAQFPTQPNAQITLEGPEGIIEAVCGSPKTPLTENGVAVICHPNSLQGGSLHNKVVHTLARAYENQGFKTVRFNFRGVGLSSGTYDDGIGECDDLRHVIQWVNAVCGEQTPIALAGFSFGGAVAIRSATSFPIRQLITVAPAVDRYADLQQIAHPPCPWLVIHGEKDDVVTCAAVQTWAAQLEQPPKIDIIENAGHFFHGKLIELRTHVEQAIESMVDGTFE